MLNVNEMQKKGLFIEFIHILLQIVLNDNL